MFGRALLRRCPRCGEGGLFRHWFTMVPTCPKCAYRFEREEGFALGASVMSLVIGQIIAVAYLIVSLILTMPDPPLIGLVVGGIALVVGSGLFIHPFTKTLWAATDLVMNRTMGSSYPISNVQPGRVATPATGAVFGTAVFGTAIADTPEFGAKVAGAEEAGTAGDDPERAGKHRI